MNFATLQKFGPIIALAARQSGTLTDPEALSIATSLAGDAAPEFVPLLRKLAEASPTTVVSELLGSPDAAKLYKKMTEEAQREPVFVQCPECDCRFETEIA